MKKIIIGLTCLILLAILSSCSKETSPESRFSEYIQLWNEQKFAKMYQYLSVDAKKAVTKAEFVDRYTQIYKDLEIHKLEVQYAKPDKAVKTKEPTKKLSFSVKMQTLAGSIEFNQTAKLIKEKQQVTNDDEDKLSDQANSKTKDKSSNEAESDTKDKSTSESKSTEESKSSGESESTDKSKSSSESESTDKTKTKPEETWYIDWSYALIFPELTAKDKISVASIPAERGEIYDRYGDPLALNGTAFEIGIVPKKINNSTVKQLARQLQISHDRIEQALAADWVQPDYFVPIAKISAQQTAHLAKLYQIPGVDKKDATARVYPFNESAAHLIGYTGPISAAELKKLAKEGYSQTDQIGKRGIEQILDSQLKGQNGAIIFIKKKNGSKITLAEKPVQNGEDVSLTIDATLQQRIYEQLNGEAGAAAAIHPITGETLALVSAPSFDANKMAIGMTGPELSALEGNKALPLLNRFKSTFVPGSVIKPITAAVALSAGTLTPEETIDVPGLTWQKDKSWNNYHITRVYDPKTPVNLEKALVYSDNIYFAQAALKLGKDNFVSGLKQFGFEAELPFLYPVEASSIGKLDSDRMVADTGYGQGQIEVSVLHLAAAYTPLINAGNMIKPILNKDEAKSQIWKKQLISVADAKTIAEGLRQVVENPKGTARSAKIKGLSIAGKTGTAELKSNKGENGAELGWFVGYKAAEPSPLVPDLLIAMMVENVQSRGGSMVPVEKVKNIFSMPAEVEEDEEE